MCIGALVSVRGLIRWVGVNYEIARLAGTGGVGGPGKLLPVLDFPRGGATPHKWARGSPRWFHE